MPVETSMKVSSDTRDRVRAIKQGGETYDEVLLRLLEEAGYNE